MTKERAGMTKNGIWHNNKKGDMYDISKGYRTQQNKAQVSYQRRLVSMYQLANYLENSQEISALSR
jgi:hypothetical protein